MGYLKQLKGLQCSQLGGEEPGGLGPPIILTGTFNLVSGHALHAARRFNVSVR